MRRRALLFRNCNDVNCMKIGPRLYCLYSSILFPALLLSRKPRGLDVFSFCFWKLFSFCFRVDVYSFGMTTLNYADTLNKPDARTHTLASCAMYYISIEEKNKKEYLFLFVVLTEIVCDVCMNLPSEIPQLFGLDHLRRKVFSTLCANKNNRTTVQRRWLGRARETVENCVAKTKTTIVAASHRSTIQKGRHFSIEFLIIVR